MPIKMAQLLYMMQYNAFSPNQESGIRGTCSYGIKTCFVHVKKEDIEKISTEIAKDISEEGISKYEEDRRDSEWEARVGLEA